jgi:hypothetical protein
MSLSTYIALARNGLCVAKTLLPKDNFLVQVVKDGPLQSVKLIEYWISVTQIAGIFFNISGGYFDIVDGLKDFKQLKGYLAIIDRLSLSGGTDGSSEYTILRHGVLSDKNSARTKMVVGFCKFNIGTAFIFLLLNTLHLTGPTHPRPLFDALIVVEVSLITILFVCLNGLLALFATSAKYSAAAGVFDSSPGVPTTHQRLLVAANSGFDANLMEALQLVDNSGFTPAYKSKNYTVDGAKRDLIALADLVGAPADDKDTNSAEIALTLQNRSAVALNTAVMDMVFLALNSMAFYGYLLGVLSYFFPAGLIDAQSVAGRLLSMLMLGLTNDQAEYYGFLAGDVAWTAEPLLAIFCPAIMAFLAPVDRVKASKKSD